MGPVCEPTPLEPSRNAVTTPPVLTVVRGTAGKLKGTSTSNAPDCPGVAPVVKRLGGGAVTYATPMAADSGAAAGPRITGVGAPPTTPVVVPYETGESN